MVTKTVCKNINDVAKITVTLDLFSSYLDRKMMGQVRIIFFFSEGDTCGDVDMVKSTRKTYDQTETASFTNFNETNPNENYTIIFAHFESSVSQPNPSDNNAQVHLKGY